MNVEPELANLLCHIYGSLIMNCNSTEETYILIKNMMSTLAFKKALLTKMWCYFLTYSPKRLINYKTGKDVYLKDY